MEQDEHRWKLPLSERTEAELRICGGPLAAADLAVLRRYVQLIEDAVLDGTSPSSAEIEKAGPDKGEIVQLKLSADPVFGGLLLRVKQRSPSGVHGYFLVPHRGGRREAWWTAKDHDLDPIGRLKWPEAEFGFHVHSWIRDGDKVRDLWTEASP